MSRQDFSLRTVLIFILLLPGGGALAALPQAVGDEELPSLAPMLAQITPAVVNIATEGRIKLRQNPLFSDPFFRRFFDLPDEPLERKTQSLGSGVIVDAERGLILTNHHVIANAVQITVTLRDGRHLEAEIVGSDPDTDVAVIQVEADNLAEIETSDSDELRVGDFVVAIGNPFGLGQTVTSGIVSALSRSGLGIEGYEDFIQTDASINPGNSGGALVNLRGELVGINTAIFSRSGGNIGIGFAIPINLALQIMEQLVETGEVKRGHIGITVQDISPELAEAFDLDKQTGAVINNVLADSPAEKVGLQPGDIIIAINDKPVKRAGDVRNYIGLLPVGEEVVFEILRNGERLEFSTVLKEGSQWTSGKAAEQNPLLKGAIIDEIGPDSPYYGRVRGVRVVEVQRGSRPWRSGLREGDIITSVNRRNITNMNEFMQLIGQVKGPLLLRIIRGNNAAFLVIK